MSSTFPAAPPRVLALQAAGRACPAPRDPLWPWPCSCSPDVPTAWSSSRQAGASGLGLPELRGRDLWLWLFPLARPPSAPCNRRPQAPPSTLYPRTLHSANTASLPITPRIKSKPLPSLQLCPPPPAPPPAPGFLSPALGSRFLNQPGPTSGAWILLFPLPRTLVQIFPRLLALQVPGQMPPPQRPS